MPDTTDDYYTAELTAEVYSTLTIAQYARVHEILDLPPGRHKKWSEHYVFELDPEQPFVLLEFTEYLREQQLEHSIERKDQWQS